MTHNDDDFNWKVPHAEDEWTWIDDLAFAFRVIMIIVVTVSACGLLLWVGLK